MQLFVVGFRMEWLDCGMYCAYDGSDMSVGWHPPPLVQVAQLAYFP